MLANLIAIGIYVWLTWGIKNASNEQSEGLSKPAVVPVTRRRPSLFNRQPSPGGPQGQSLEEAAVERYGYATELDEDDLRLQNIGTGPAIQVRCTIESENGSQGPYIIPYLPPSKQMQVDVTTFSLRGTRGSIRCAFEGLTGIGYVTETPFFQDGTVGNLKLRRRRAASKEEGRG